MVVWLTLSRVPGEFLGCGLTALELGGLKPVPRRAPVDNGRPNEGETRFASGGVVADFADLIDLF